ncbi:MAG TPA: sensor histidine kinase N-terminal domain-containing protein [Rhodocyclaceae bacterium]
MLAPLLFVWPISIAITHYFATQVAGFPYDQALRDHVGAIVRLVRIDNGVPQINLSTSARALLRSDEVDFVYFHVATRDGNRLIGDREFPFANDILSQPDEPGTTHFRDAVIKGRDVRVAYQYLADPSITRDRWVLVEVAETLEKRNQLTNRIVASVILPQFIIIPLAIVLVWFGLSQGLKPLTRLRRRIERRPANDLSEIKSLGVPEEIGPLIAAFNAMIARMQKNVAAQHRFIADAAHQLRTPLAGLKAQAQAARREPDPAVIERALENLVAGVDRANRLVTQMLSLARAGGGDQALPMEDVTLDSLIRDIAAEWTPRMLDKGMDFGFETNAVAVVTGNAFLLREMFNNLLDNALRYTPDGGRITARVTLHGDFVIVEIEDSGIGIPELDAEQVFEPFYRADNAGPEGSGLGLAIVREIALLHRADVSLRPVAEGGGTVARVVFPVREDEDRRASEVAAVVMRQQPAGFV